jgi:hypothetical protein
MPDSIEVSLPEPLKRWVDEQAQSKGSKGYRTSGDYVGEVLRQEQIREAQRRVDEKLVEAHEGPSREMTDEAWRELREAARERVKKGSRS